MLFAVSRNASIVVPSGGRDSITDHTDLSVPTGCHVTDPDAADELTGTTAEETGTVPSIIERRPALFFLGHISPIFAPFFLVFSRFSPS